MKQSFEAIIIGTGFGGSISACRLAKRWPGKILVVERGKRYPMGSFPRNPHEMAKNFFNIPSDQTKRPKQIPKDQRSTGLFDIRSFANMDVVTAAGVGGGSLIYANVFMEPPDHVFDHRWPASLTREQLAPYYQVAKDVLGARPIPNVMDQRRRILRTEYFQEIARSMGRESKLVDLNVYFGNDFQNPLPIGHQDINRYGARQTSCTYCAECDLGCNYHAKNSLDLNYFYVAEKRYGAQLRAEHKAFKIVPLNQSGKEDPSQDGSYGFAVYLYDIQADQVYIVNSQRVILAAGTLNTNEILLRNRDEYHTLSRISHQLGQNFSGNGDFLSFILNSDRAADPNYGPVITQRIDFNLFDDFDAKKAFIMEDASYPALLAWYLEGQKPFWYKWSALKAFFRGVWDTFLARGNFHRSGRLLAELLKYDLSFRSSVHLCMGLDQSDGVIRLDKRRDLALDWPYQNSMPLYQAILQSMRQAKEKVNGESWFPLPTWHLNRNVSVHPLGGCRLGHGSETSVTSAESEQFGQVWSYQNLYVADGALVPTAIGANPSATIAALAEKVAEGISKIKPTAEL